MGHNLEQLGTASLDTMGGLVTNCNPSDLPEGASPRCYDVDFITGSVFTRYGLSSVYTYAATILITQVIVGSSNLATFSYTNGTPTVNEGFVLQNFSGSSSFLNGQTIFVLGVNLIAQTFTADVTGVLGTYINLSGSAVSTVGQFLGPNAPTGASQSGTGNAWTNPNNILGSVAYASVQSGASANVTPAATTGGNLGAGVQWVSPANIAATGTTYTTCSLTAQSSVPDVASGFSIVIPSTATVVGVQLHIDAFGSVSGKCAIYVSLCDSVTHADLGTAVGIPLGTTKQTFTPGSSSYLWGNSAFTVDEFNNSHLGVKVIGAVSSGTATISANNLKATVYYTLAGSSEVLSTSGYAFTVPSTAGITGVGVTFQAYTSASSSVSVQLLRNGVAVGTAKTQTLTTTPTIYTLGGSSDLWSYVWLYSDIDNPSWGVAVTSNNNGTTFINDLDAIVYVTPAQVNFNYVKSYIQDNGQTYTLALDASGLLWQENVTSAPGTLSLAQSGILPGSFAKSVTSSNNEYILFSDLSIGTERPRVYYRGQQFLPLSQGGPGAPPQFKASQQASGGVLAITAFTVSGGVATFTFTASGGFVPVVNSLYTIASVNPLFNGLTFSVLGTPAPTTTQFSVASAGSTSGAVPSGTATPAFTYNISAIVQNGSTPLATQVGAVSANGQELLWSAGPGQTTPGSVWTFYYGGANVPENASLLAAFNSGNAVYVYISGSAFGNGTNLATGHSAAKPPNETDNVPYLTMTAPYSNYTRVGGPAILGNVGTFQQTLATVTVSTPIPSLSTGDTLKINGVATTAWNGTWTVVDALNSGVYDITATQMSAAGVGSYTFSVQSGTAPAVGEIVTIANCTNNAIFNTTGVIATVVGAVFTISGFTSGAIALASEASATGVSYGTKFTFDPGATLAGSTTNPIFGNVAAGGSVGITSGATVPVGSGTRQGVVYFITTSGYETQPSIPVTFTTSADANFITASQIPLGPPNTVARGLAFTEAGQNGVPGANFYVIEQPFVTTVNGQTRTYSSTIINNNTDTSAQFTFTDAVLLNSREVDVQGDNLFNLIELGSSAWAVPYSGRVFYGLQLNKINNWTSGGTLSFDGGYLPNPGGNIQPLGWNIANSNDQTLISSPVTGQALYIKNTSGGTQTTGVIYQTAYQDAYGVAIIRPNTSYSVRVACSIPSGLTAGTLTVDLVDFLKGTGFKTASYGSFTVPLSSMTPNVKVFSGTLLTTAFTSGVSANLQLRVRVVSMGKNADCTVDRIEVYETLNPYLKAQVYGSYPNQPEAIDASSTGGVIDTTVENSQACMGAFVMHDLLYIMKTSSMYSTQDNPNSEPGGWGLHEVSNRVGTIGISSYDVGEEWMVTACRNGIFGFNGGQPVKIMQELWNLWEQINWDAGNTIVLRNDVVNKRLYCAIPLPTGRVPATGVAVNKETIKWLPNAPYNPTPTSPNVMLMLNYQGMATFEEMVNSPEVHTTMFGTLAAVDMKRKWTIWNIATPAMDFIMQPDGESAPLYICNGIASSKIYQLLQSQTSDDGVAINGLYTTYGFVNAAKAATLPIFGFHAKRYTVLQTNISGAQTDTTSTGNATIRILANTLTPKFPYTVPVGIPLYEDVQDDFFRPINVKGNRAYVEVSTNAVGSWFNLSKLLLTGKADPWSTINPTGGGNLGIS